VTAVLLAGARGYAPDPVFEIPGQALDRANDSEKAVDSFCAAGNGRGQIEIGLASGLLWPGAALEQSRNRSPELGSAAALPVSVSRHLVSTSVQFGPSAAEKTESDQSPLVAHLYGQQVGIDQEKAAQASGLKFSEVEQ